MSDEDSDVSIGSFLLAAQDAAQAIAMIHHPERVPDDEVASALVAMDNLERAFHRLAAPRDDAATEILVDLCARLHRAIAARPRRSPTFYS